MLSISKADFDRLLADGSQLAAVVRWPSHDRAITNLSSNEDLNPTLWAGLARGSPEHLTRKEETGLLREAGAGPSAGRAIVFGSILDTIPGWPDIGAKFSGLEGVSLTLILGMWLGGTPEATASTAMLRKGGYSDRKVFDLWSAVLAAGIVAAIAGGAMLAPVAHAMIPEALHKGGSAVV